MVKASVGFSKKIGIVLFKNLCISLSCECMAKFSKFVVVNTFINAVSRALDKVDKGKLTFLQSDWTWIMHGASRCLFSIWSWFSVTNS